MTSPIVVSWKSSVHDQHWKYVLHELNTFLWQIGKYCRTDNSVYTLLTEFSETSYVVNLLFIFWCTFFWIINTDSIKTYFIEWSHFYSSFWPSIDRRMWAWIWYLQLFYIQFSKWLWLNIHYHYSSYVSITITSLELLSILSIFLIFLLSMKKEYC